MELLGHIKMAWFGLNLGCDRFVPEQQTCKHV